MPSLTIALLGATGNVGGHYARLALDAGHSLRALARNPAKLDPIIPNGADHPNVTAVAGDATNPDDIANLIEGADVLVSCLGNPNPSKGVHIMTAAANNVLEVAADLTSVGDSETENAAVEVEHGIEVAYSDRRMAQREPG